MHREHLGGVISGDAEIVIVVVIIGGRYFREVIHVARDGLPEVLDIFVNCHAAADIAGAALDREVKHI